MRKNQANDVAAATAATAAAAAAESVSCYASGYSYHRGVTVFAIIGNGSINQSINQFICQKKYIFFYFRHKLDSLFLISMIIVYLLYCIL